MSICWWVVCECFHPVTPSEYCHCNTSSRPHNPKALLSFLLNTLVTPDPNTLAEETLNLLLQCNSGFFLQKVTGVLAQLPPSCLLSPLQTPAVQLVFSMEGVQCRTGTPRAFTALSVWLLCERWRHIFNADLVNLCLALMQTLSWMDNCTSALRRDVEKFSWSYH